MTNTTTNSGTIKEVKILLPGEPRSEVSALRAASVAIGQELAGSLQELLLTKYSACGLRD